MDISMGNVVRFDYNGRTRYGKIINIKMDSITIESFSGTIKSFTINKVSNYTVFSRKGQFAQ